MKSQSSNNHRVNVAALSCCAALAVMALAANNAFGLNYTNNLQAWYDAHMVSISPPPEGSTVSQWNDSGNVHSNMLQPTVDRRPIYHSNVISGNPAVHFDGTNDLLTAGDVTFLDGISNVTIFAVVKVGPTLAASGFFQPIFTKYDSGTAFSLMVNPAGNFQAEFVSGSATSANVITDGVARVLEATYDGSTINAYINGVLAGTASQTGVIPDTTDRLALGAFVTGAGGFPDETLNGDIAEVLIYTETLSTANRKLVENYLGDRYSITVPEVSTMPLVLLASVGIFVLRRRIKHSA